MEVTGLRSGLPPSALPGISPSKGEIDLQLCRASRKRRTSGARCVAHEPGGRIQPISPLEGEMSGRTEGGDASAVKIRAFP
jgi:diaminohydroxyphosphoribosylaminopyrimidine deaminase/5-amino-6-(5-phosphoribosylamino)uracil reductase